MDKLFPLLASLFKMNESELTDELSMDHVALWDSLKHMELITSIEEELLIELTADDIMDMISIKAIKKIVAEKVS